MRCCVSHCLSVGITKKPCLPPFIIQHSFVCVGLPYSVKLRVVKVDLPEIQEVDTEGIAKDKVILATQLANGPSLVEDTSLEFHALGGA